MWETCGKIGQKKQKKIFHCPVAPCSVNCREQPVSALPGLGLQAGTTTQREASVSLFVLLMWVLGIELWSFCLHSQHFPD